MEECQKYACLYTISFRGLQNTKIRTNCWKNVGKRFNIDHKEANKNDRSTIDRHLWDISATENDKQKWKYLQSGHKLCLIIVFNYNCFL